MEGELKTCLEWILLLPEEIQQHALPAFEKHNPYGLTDLYPKEAFLSAAFLWYRYGPFDTPSKNSTYWASVTVAILRGDFELISQKQRIIDKIKSEIKVGS